MQFKTEFSLKFPYQLSTSETHKVRHQLDIGNKIADHFNWEEEFDDDENRFKIEIEAFPTHRWIEFKNALFEYLHASGGNVSGVKILQMIKDLEFYGNRQDESTESNVL